MSSIFRPLDWPIFYKLLFAFVMVAILALVPITYINQQQARQGLLQEAQRNLSNTARNTTSAINDYLLARLSDVEQIATNDSVTAFMDAASTDRTSLGPNNLSQRDSLNLLKTRAPLLGNNSYIFLASAGGQVELTSEPDGSIRQGEPSNVAGQKYFLGAVKGTNGYYLSDPQLSIYDDTINNIQAVIYISRPVRGTNGIEGAVVARLTMVQVWQIVNKDKEAAGPGSFSMLVDNSGIRIADSRADSDNNKIKYIFTTLYQIPSGMEPGGRGELQASGRFPDAYNYAGRQEAIPAIYDRAKLAMYNLTNQFFEVKANGADSQAAYNRVDLMPWSYFVIVPNSTYAAAANQITNTAVIIGGIFLVLLFLFAFLLARTLTGPVRRIIRVLGRIGMGDFEARVPVRSRDELGRLSETLNAMFDNTLTLIQTREEKEELQMQITRLLNEISTVAEGDLTVQAEVTADITGAIADSFNLMIDELRKIIMNIQAATTQTTVYMDHMVNNAQRIDMVADRQANRVMVATRAIADMNTSIQRVSASANDAAGVAQEARSNARHGGEAVTQTIASMNRIRGNVQETAKKIKRLGESSQQIGEIVKLIDDIADQTNMLALNAAIQAAMAGEQGKGFSVVTEEVRRLAQRSANATREIAGLVKSIQDDTAAAVVAMEESTSEVVEGSRVADEAGNALNSIELVVDKLATLILSISQVSQQQASTSSSIAQSMTEILALTQQATALRRESSEVVAQVARTAEELRSSVSAFKVNSEPPALEAGNIYDHPGPIEGVITRQPFSGGPTFTPPPQPNLIMGLNQTAPAPVQVPGQTNGQKDSDLNALLEDQEFFNSILSEVATSRPGNGAPRKAEPEKHQPQALG